MWQPVTVVFGLRHKKLFQFLDYAGEMIDAVIALQEQDADLPRELFEEVAWQKTRVRLRDRRETVTADFDVDGVVLTVNLAQTHWERDDVKRIFLALLRGVLPITGGADRVDRIGIVEAYHLQHRRSGEVAVGALTNLGDLGDAADFGMRVSFRRATEEGLVRGDVEDWRNTIIQIANRQDEREPEDRLVVSIDYQIYFVPARPYAPDLVDDHYRLFVERLEHLQAGRLAGLAPAEQLAR